LSGECNDNSLQLLHNSKEINRQINQNNVCNEANPDNLSSTIQENLDDCTKVSVTSRSQNFHTQHSATKHQGIGGLPLIENHTTQIQVDRDNQGQTFSLKDIGKKARSIFKPNPLRWHLRNPQQHENYFRKVFRVRPPPRTSPAAEPAKRAEPVPRLHRQLPRHQYPLVSVLHATQGVGLDQISRDCTPNHYYAMNSQLSSSQYNNQ
jgi:hypothetical protein